MPRYKFFQPVIDFNHCILCGGFICMQSVLTSMGIFRALYVAADGIELSGVGSMEHQRFLKVPTDPNKRWNTMGDDFILLKKSKCWPWNVYLFHERCWEHFMEHFSPGELELTRLYEVLKRLPIPNEPRGLYNTMSPFETPSLAQLLQSTNHLSKPTTEVAKALSTALNPTDCFRYLPLEIQDIIGSSLSITDFLSLRHASRSMAALFSSSIFWKSRFQIDRERGFLNYLVKEGKPDRDIDWRLLYHSTCNMRCSHTFSITIRMWEIFRWLKDAFLMKHPEKPLLEFGGRALQHYHNTCWDGTHIKRISIPPSIIKIGIHLLSHKKKMSDITGLEFISEDMPSVMIGYGTPGAEIISEEEASTRPAYESFKIKAIPKSLEASYKYPGAHIWLDARSFRGFAFEGGRDGIHKIALLRDTQNSRMFGMNYGSSRGKISCEMVMDNVTEVVATCDFYKILDLGIRGLGTRQQEQSKRDVWRSFPEPVPDFDGALRYRGLLNEIDNVQSYQGVQGFQGNQDDDGQDDYGEDDYGEDDYSEDDYSEDDDDQDGLDSDPDWEGW